MPNEEILPIEPNSDLKSNLIEKPIEPNSEPTTKLTVSKQDKAIILANLNEHLATMERDPKVKKTVLATIKKDMPHLKDSQLKSLYRQAEHDFYLNLKRIPAEALLSKINETTEYLQDRILTESKKDIIYQAQAINDLNTTLAKINKITDVAPVVQINFHQELPESYLLNPIIDITPKEIDK